MIDIGTLKALVARELEIIADPERRRALEAILVEPVMRERSWDYGAEDERYRYWLVAESPGQGGIELAYCEEGFGPQFPWGFLFPDEDSLGMDSQWSWYLEEAFVRAGLWRGSRGRDEAYHLPPEVRFPGQPRRGFS